MDDKFCTLIGDCGEAKPNNSNVHDIQPLINILIKKISDHTDAEIKRFDEEIKKRRGH